MIKGKSPEEIRQLFNIENDWTQAELEAVQKENQWCEEKWSVCSGDKNQNLEPSINNNKLQKETTLIKYFHFLIF